MRDVVFFLSFFLPLGTGGSRGKINTFLVFLPGSPFHYPHLQLPDRKFSVSCCSSITRLNLLSSRITWCWTTVRQQRDVYLSISHSDLLLPHNWGFPNSSLSLSVFYLTSQGVVGTFSSLSEIKRKKSSTRSIKIKKEKKRKKLVLHDKRTDTYICYYGNWIASCLIIKAKSLFLLFSVSAKCH